MSNIIEQTAGDFLQSVGAAGFNQTEVPSIGRTWGELKDLILLQKKSVIFGGHRGQVIISGSSTNIGKTTFALNVSILRACGEAFPPFFDGSNGINFKGNNNQRHLRK